MSDVLLGIIAASLVVMAVVQVAVVVFAAVFATRTARRLDQLANRLEQDIRPIIASVQALTADASRATALAAVQVERADKIFADFAQRIEQTLKRVEDTVSGMATFVGNARDTFSVVDSISSIFGAFRNLRAVVRKRPSTVEEEEALFIG